MGENEFARVMRKAADPQVLFRFYRKPTDRDVAERMPSRLSGGS
jgi:hypothetical protein